MDALLKGHGRRRTRRSRRWRGATTGLLTCAVTLVLCEIAVDRWLSPPRCALLETKWADFERCADACDIIFLGTSHIERHIDPHVVDQTLAEYKYRSCSYNLGLPKMSMLEAAVLIERLKHRRPRRLKLVVIEPTLYLYDADNWSTNRAMAEHNWRGALTAARLTWASERRRGTGLWGKIKCISPHALSLLCRTAGLRRAEYLFAAVEEGTTISLGVGNAGFRPLPVVDVATATGGACGDWRERFRRFLRTQADWNGEPLSPEEEGYYKRMIEQIQETGAEPMFLLGPKVKRDSHTAAFLASYQQEFADVPLVDHLRGHVDSAIYDLRYWHDFDHLNAEGARFFSRQFAGQLYAFLSSSSVKQARHNEHRPTKLPFGWWTGASLRLAYITPRPHQPRNPLNPFRATTP